MLEKIINAASNSAKRCWRAEYGILTWSLQSRRERTHPAQNDSIWATCFGDIQCRLSAITTCSDEPVEIELRGSRSPPKTDCPVRINSPVRRGYHFCCNAINLRSAGHQILMMFHTANMLGNTLRATSCPSQKAIGRLGHEASNHLVCNLVNLFAWSSLTPVPGAAALWRTRR